MPYIYLVTCAHMLQALSAYKLIMTVFQAKDGLRFYLLSYAHTPAQ